MTKEWTRRSPDCTLDAPSQRRKHPSQPQNLQNMCYRAFAGEEIEDVQARHIVMGGVPTTGWAKLANSELEL